MDILSSHDRSSLVSRTWLAMVHASRDATCKSLSVMTQMLSPDGQATIGNGTKSNRPMWRNRSFAHGAPSRDFTSHHRLGIKQRSCDINSAWSSSLCKQHVGLHVLYSWRLLDRPPETHENLRRWNPLRSAICRTLSSSGRFWSDDRSNKLVCVAMDGGPIHQAVQGHETTVKTTVFLLAHMSPSVTLINFQAEIRILCCFSLFVPRSQEEEQAWKA